MNSERWRCLWMNRNPWCGGLDETYARRQTTTTSLGKAKSKWSPNHQQIQFSDDRLQREGDDDELDVGEREIFAHHPRAAEHRLEHLSPRQIVKS